MGRGRDGDEGDRAWRCLRGGEEPPLGPSPWDVRRCPCGCTQLAPVASLGGGFAPSGVLLQLGWGLLGQPPEFWPRGLNVWHTRGHLNRDPRPQAFLCFPGTIAKNIKISSICCLGHGRREKGTASGLRPVLRRPCVCLPQCEGKLLRGYRFLSSPPPRVRGTPPDLPVPVRRPVARDHWGLCQPCCSLALAWG